MSALDSKIDDLYRLPLSEFTGARNALAKALTGDEAKRVRALAKPPVVPWAVNQVYWRARGTYDRLMTSGEKLRAAQIAALQGRAADVRAASEAHRRAISNAVAEAQRLAAASGAKPGGDALARMFESLSLATTAPASPGRLTEALQPAGFEALAGVPNLELSTPHREPPKRTAEPRTLNVVEPRTAPVEPRTSKAAKRAAAEAARAAAERKKYEAAVKNAEEALTRVEGAERDARAAWEKAHDDLLAARQALTDVRRNRFRRS